MTQWTRLHFWQIRDVSSQLLLCPQGAVWVCQKSSQTSGPGWWSESSPWWTRSISSARTTWSVSANTPNSCSPLGTSHANCVYKWALRRIKKNTQQQLYYKQKQKTDISQHNCISSATNLDLLSVFLTVGIEGFCCCQSTISWLGNWSGHCEQSDKGEIFFLRSSGQPIKLHRRGLYLKNYRLCSAFIRKDPTNSLKTPRGLVLHPMWQTKWSILEIVDIYSGY